MQECITVPEPNIAHSRSDASSLLHYDSVREMTLINLID